MTINFYPIEDYPRPEGNLIAQLGVSTTHRVVRVAIALTLGVATAVAIVALPESETEFVAAQQETDTATDVAAPLAQDTISETGPSPTANPLLASAVLGEFSSGEEEPDDEPGRANNYSTTNSNYQPRKRMDRRWQRHQSSGRAAENKVLRIDQQLQGHK